MRIQVIAAACALLVSTSAAAMPVSIFLQKADALRAKGPLALFSGDIKLLMDQIKADSAQLRAERLAAKAANQKPAFCPPDSGVKLSDKDIMGAMQAVPVPQRPHIQTKDAMRGYMARRFPCPA